VRLAASGRVGGVGFFVVVDAHCLPFRDEIFDCVFAFNACGMVLLICTPNSSGT